MDEILEKTIQLGCLIRDSPEGMIWRESSAQLDEIPLSTPNLGSLPPDQIPMIENLGLIHKANKVRPLLLPLIVGRYSPHLDHNSMRKELNKNQKVWKPYRQLELCMVFTGILVTFLRKIAPGYPHKDLIYTMPNSEWTELSSFKELPWNMATSIIPEKVIDAKQLGLERVLPNTWPVIISALNSLAESIKRCPTWLNLHKAYRAIERQNNLKIELNRAKEQFDKEFAPYKAFSVAKPTRFNKFEDLTKHIYGKRGKRISKYVDMFLQYEWLVERIYWTLSQLIMFENISCIASSISQQLQQVSLNYGKEAYLTALAKTRGKSLAIGQLVHITLPESNNIADGLYQVESLRQEYNPDSGVHILFRNRKLWYCKLDFLLLLEENNHRSTYLQNEEQEMVNGTKIDIMDGEEVVDTWDLGDLFQLKFSETMYLP